MAPNEIDPATGAGLNQTPAQQAGAAAAPPAQPPQGDGAPGGGGGDMQKDFPKETPGIYKWTVGAVGFVTAVMGVVASLKIASLALVGSATVFALLLIFVLFCFEKDDINTQWQSRVLSWFASGVLVFLGVALLSSMFFDWPRRIITSSKIEAARETNNIVAYDLRNSSIARKPGSPTVWIEHYRNRDTAIRTFQERRWTPDYVLFWDDERKIYVRIPTAGGIAQFTTVADVETCNLQPCWQAIAPVDARLVSAIWLNSN